jgi:hypothetical protein
MTKRTKARRSRTTPQQQAGPGCTAPRDTILLNRAKVVQDEMF